MKYKIGNSFHLCDFFLNIIFLKNTMLLKKPIKVGVLMHFVVAFLISFSVTILCTPIVKRIAQKYDIVDKPDFRKIHTKVTPRLGGLSIIIGFFLGYLYLLINSPLRYNASFYGIILGTLLITAVGVVDDKYTLPPEYKLLGQLFAAFIVTFYGVTIQFITLPVIGEVSFGWASYPITIFWIISITNAINLIDGLDGLACGVSAIAVTAMLILAIFNNEVIALALSVILLGSSLGFLYFNVHPAKIFMGDTGALFIGFIISIISILGLFKSVAFFSFVIPISILAVPIFDTSFAILRRINEKKKISSPDKQHLHHRLLACGFSHQSTVYIIYTMSIFFALTAVLFSRSLLWGSLAIVILVSLTIKFTTEAIGHVKKTPLIDTVKKILMTLNHN